MNEQPPVDDPSLQQDMPPVGDIKLSKTKGTYNTYKLELSMGQIEAIRDALEKDHSNPISDELLALFTYYIEKVPGPGEEEEDAKMRQAHPGQAADEEGDFPIPMPPREGGGAPMGEEPPTPTGAGAPPMEEPEGGAPEAAAPLPEPSEEEAHAGELDQRLSEPPPE